MVPLPGTPSSVPAATRLAIACLLMPKPRANDAVFYKWTGSSMEVFGVGSHGVTNTDYVLTWYDGNRATVDLKAKTIV